MYKKSVFWFRQDLRTFDNLWLIECIKSSEEILPIFIFDENIIDWFWGFNDTKFLFLKQTLLRLDFELSKIWANLNVFYWDPENIITALVKENGIDSVFCNKSYSKYWTSRDSKISEKLNIELIKCKDYLLNEPEEIPQRKVFTPFYKLWQKELDTKKIELQSPKQTKWIKISEAKNVLDSFISWEKHPYFTLEFWEKRLKDYSLDLYDEFRNDLDKDWTSKLSVYTRFWIFSIRELYLKWKWKWKSDSFISELAWREFWQHINYYFPESKNIEFQEKRRNIEWKNDKILFEKWCKWETWYPIVDACMKQLLETNWMHWRGRMIVASFLTKDLLIDWRWWEKFFKKHLLDYDENVNVWNWQWSASVWADPKPIRIFSPLLQAERFDKDCKFIKKYIPKLENEDIKHIQNPLKYELSNYIKPIIDHSEAQRIAKEEYKKSWLFI